MKVVYIIDTLKTGGTEKSLLHITSRLKGVEPIVITLFDKKHDLISDFRNAGVQVIELALKPGDKFWLPKAVKRLNKLFHDLQPKVVHAHLYNGELAARLASKKNGHILIGSFVNDPYVEERFSQASAIQSFKISVYKWLDRITAMRVNAFTSLTRAIAVTNAKALKIPSSKIKIIPRGRPVNNFFVEHPSFAGEFSFLCVARLLKRKGYFDLIKAVRILKEKNKPIKILAAGDGVDAAAIKDFAKENNVESNIVFLGNCNNVPELLAKCHGFVLPSHYEGMGASLMEAMFAAKPVIASDIDVFKEQVVHGRTGLLFETMNAVDLAAKMEWMIDNYSAAIEMGEKAREFAVEHFDIDKVAMRYEEYYCQLAGKTMPVINSNQTVVA